MDAKLEGYLVTLIVLSIVILIGLMLLLHEQGVQRKLLEELRKTRPNDEEEEPYYLFCTNCNTRFYDTCEEFYGAPIAEIRDRAENFGWIYKHLNGGWWDLCPTCQTD